MQKTMTGTDGTVGASYTWKGNDEVGAGRMIAKERVPGRLAVNELVFTEPFESVNEVRLEVEPAGTGSKATWTMIGPSPFPMKLMSVFVDMSEMIGKDFDKGLAKLDRVTQERAKKAAAEKAAAEAAAPAPAADAATP